MSPGTVVALYFAIRAVKGLAPQVCASSDRCFVGSIIVMETPDDVCKKEGREEAEKDEGKGSSVGERE